MEIEFLGTSCMVPTRERNHQAIFLSYKGDGLLIDCGEGTQRQLKIAEIRPPRITKILLTHWHGDHVLGLPGLLQTLNGSNYDGELEIYGPKGTLSSFENMFRAFGFRIGFSHKIVEISGKGSIKGDDLDIEYADLKHSLPCLGYAIQEKSTRRIKVSAVRKLGIPDGPLLGRLQDNKEIMWKGKKVTPEETTYLVNGKKATIILDTLPCNNSIDLAMGSDLLICEASYDSDLLSKAEENFHLTAQQAAMIAVKSGSARLVLTHFSQRYKTLEKIKEEAESRFDKVVLAYDFMKIKA